LPTVVLVLGLVVSAELLIARAGRGADVSSLKNRESIWLQRMRQIARASAPADVLFLGDSTVERAIDDELFAASGRLSCRNLGLTGDLGTYGDNAVLERYLELHPPPRAIVIWHSIDVWGRDLDRQLFAFTLPGSRDTVAAITALFSRERGLKAWIAAPVDTGSQLIQNALMRLPSYRNRSWLRNELSLSLPVELPVRRAGVERTPVRDMADQIAGLRGRRFTISEDSRLWFEKTLALARSRGILVVAARSPLHRQVVADADSRPFVEESNRVLSEFFKGHEGVIQVNQENLVFDEAEGAGDKDHVGALGRARITQYYAGRLAELVPAASR
jgi:hypothetical protein